MTYEVSQWLEEIKSLQQQLAQAQSDREAAQASAEHWRELYNTEAQQRRTEAKAAEQTIETLKAEIQQLKDGRAGIKSDGGGEGSSIEKELEKLPAGELKVKLAEAMQQRDRLAGETERLVEALKAEQAAHLKTRQSLTTALGDTMDRLKATRAAILGPEAATGQLPAQRSSPPQTASASYQLPAQSKNPSLQLPPINPDRSPA